MVLPGVRAEPCASIGLKLDDSDGSGAGVNFPSAGSSDAAVNGDRTIESD